MLIPKRNKIKSQINYKHTCIPMLVGFLLWSKSFFPGDSGFLSPLPPLTESCILKRRRISLLVNFFFFFLTRGAQASVCAGKVKIHFYLRNMCTSQIGKKKLFHPMTTSTQFWFTLVKLEVKFKYNFIQVEFSFFFNLFCK